MSKSIAPPEQHPACPKTWEGRVCIHEDGEGHAGICTYPPESEPIHSSTQARLELLERRRALKEST